MVEIILEDSTLEFSDPIWDPLAVIKTALPKLPARDRAFIRKWCRQVIIEQDVILGQDDSSLCPRDTDDHIHRHVVIRAMDYIRVLLKRYGSGKFGGLRMLGQALLYYVCSHLLTTDPGYFDCIEKTDNDWAEGFIQRLCVRGDLPLQLKDVRHTRYFDTSTPASGEGGGGSWTVVRVETGRRYHLYRCLVAYGVGDLQRGERSGSGLLLSLEDEISEWSMAVHISGEMQRVWHEAMDEIRARKPDR